MQSESNVDPNVYKGLLPVYLREGIPPYLQILFSARPQLPYVKPKEKSRIPPLRSFSEDKERLKELKNIMETKRQERLKKEEEAIKDSKKHKLTAKEKETLWFTKMKEHISKIKEEYKEWVKHSKYSNDGKTSNPYKTLIVYNLVR